MKRTIQKLLLLIFACSLLFSCNNQSNPGMKKSITGRAGEMVIVISKANWDSIPGRLLRNTLAQPQVSLPQEEPLFSLVDVPHNAFNNIFKTTRNIVTTLISPTVDNPGVRFKNDVWASPQATVEIHAKNYQEFNDLLNENSGKIISYFLKAEKSRLQSNYRKIHDKGLLNTIKEKYGITMYCLPGFQLATNKENFIWYRYDTPDITQGIFVYTIDYKSDSIFTPEYLVYKRNELLKKYVAGPTEGSYMTTEMRVDPVFNIFEHNGNYTAEMRGLWRTEHDFMGGPYIQLAELDASNQRVVVAEGFVYAPGKDKRNLLRQVEAMIYSMEFANQKMNDKINSEIKMGN